MQQQTGRWYFRSLSSEYIKFYTLFLLKYMIETLMTLGVGFS